MSHGMNVLQLLASTRWAMRRDSLQQLLSIAERDIDAILASGVRASEDDDSRAGDDKLRKRQALFTAPATAHPKSERLGVRDGVAILPIVGPLCRYSSWIQDVCGMTSYQLAAMDFRTALEDSSIRAILVHLDTPGGEVNGCAELAQLIYSSRGIKPIVAMVSDGAASAGYWIAAACDEIVVTPAAYVGSIGVYFEIWDDSEAIKEAGFRRFRIVSSQSPNKVPDPATDAGDAVLQREADQFGDAFTEAAAEFRGCTPAALIAQGDGGAVFIGRHAVAQGLADRVGTTEAVLAELATRDLSQPAPTRAARVPITQESAMKSTTKVAAPKATTDDKPVDEELTDEEKAKKEKEKAAEPATPPAVDEEDELTDEEKKEEEAAARRAQRAKGAATERARISAILALPGSAAHAGIVQACIADPACSASDAALKILAAKPATVVAGSHLSAFFAAETPASAPSASTGDSGGTSRADEIIAAHRLVRGRRN